MQGLEQVPWPGWRVVRLIGHGNFGAVYEIQREVFGEIESSALKVISIPENGTDIDDLRVEGLDDASITARFQGYLKDIVREYSTMAKMKGHPNIVYCDDIKYVQHDDGFGWDIYIKMELLTPVMKCLGRLNTESAVIDLGIAICSALVLCKECGILHRDVKPQNIFVSKGGVYKLGDFGIAKTAEKTTSGTKIGTYKYMAPEVYNNRPYGPSADQYSLGLVLYWLLNDYGTPFSPRKATATEESIARKRRFDGEPIPPPAHGSKRLQAIVLKACAYDPKDRFASAAEMLAALQALKTGAAPAVSPVPAPEPVAAAATLAAGGGTVGVFDRNASAPALASARPKAVSSADALTVGPADRRKGPADRAGASAPPSAPEKKKEKKKKPLWLLLPAAAAIALMILFALGKAGGKPLAQAPVSEPVQAAAPEQTSEPVPEQTSEPAQPPEQEQAPAPEPANPVQLTWTEWGKALPPYVTREEYDIEERTLYRSRTRETTSSTTSSVMDGWELYDTVSGNGDFGPWSDWSMTAPAEAGTREIGTQTRYRYRDKETTTSTSSSLSGWTLESTSTSWGDYGAWSGWTTSAVSASDIRQVETKTQYRYRDKEYKYGVTDPNLSGWTRTGSRTEYGSWSGNQTTTSKPTESDTLRIVDQYVSGYNYYHYCCNYYNGKNNVDSIPYGNTNNTHYHTTSRTTALPAFNMPDRGGNQAYGGLGSGAPGCSSGFYAWFLGGYTYTYVYQTRSATTYYDYERWSDTWSSWSDTYYAQSSSRQVETRTMYRYRDRQQITTYHFYRWGNWSPWSESAYAVSGTRQVETATFYRYRDRVTQLTYYFRRWTDWSAFSETYVAASDTTEVQTRTEYRYKSKGS